MSGFDPILVQAHGCTPVAGRSLSFEYRTARAPGARGTSERVIDAQDIAKVAMGVYDVQTIVLNVEGFFTTTTQVDAYRGAGRPEASYLLERIIDIAARDLNMDPIAIRRKNFIKIAQ